MFIVKILSIDCFSYNNECWQKNRNIEIQMNVIFAIQKRKKNIFFSSCININNVDVNNDDILNIR